jgi:hypothetical protein
MFKFEDIRRIAAAAVGAIILSTVCVGAAIGPVQATAPSVQQVA